MPYGLYLSAEGAQAQSQRLDVIANNLANVNTPGFKPDYVSFQARFAEAIEQGLEQTGVGEEEDVGGGVVVTEVQPSFAPGRMKETGRDLDMALGGEGFFQVQKGEEQYLTRAGNFRLSPTGQLETQGGYAVLNDAGGPVFINPELGPWQLSPDGAIEQQGARTLLALVQPESYDELVKSGENMFSTLADPQPVLPANRRVMGGVLEYSGVHPTTAMMELIEASRAVEANMQLIQNQDNMLGSLISRVLTG